MNQVLQQMMKGKPRTYVAKGMMRRKEARIGHFIAETCFLKKIQHTISALRYDACESPDLASDASSEVDEFQCWLFGGAAKRGLHCKE